MAENFETEDGRKILSVNNAGVHVTLESTEQAAKGRAATAEAEIAEMKLAALKGGIRHVVAKNPGPTIPLRFFR